MNFNKLSKYSYRLTKSIKNNKKFKSIEYAQHLKHYIQTGGDERKNLSEKLNLLEGIIEKINTSPDLQLQKIQEKLKNTEKELEESKTKIDELEKESKTKIAELENKANELNAAKDGNDDEIKNNKDTITKLNEKIKELEEEKNKNDELVKNKETELKNLQDKIIALISTNELTKTEINEKVNEAIEKIKEKQKECDESKNRSLDLDSKQTEIEKLKKQLTEEQEKFNNLSKEIEDLKQQIKDLEEKNKKLEKEFDDFDQDKANKLNELLKKLFGKIYGESSDIIESFFKGTPPANPPPTNPI